MSDSRSNDTIVKTLIVALLLCLVCSIVVSLSAVMLKPEQISNKNLEKQKNILLAAGLLQDASASKNDIETLFDKVEVKLIELDNGEYVEESTVDPKLYDQRKAAKDPELSRALTTAEDEAGIRRLEKYSFVYLVNKDGKLDKIVLPIRGYGLWSTLYGFLALESDGYTVAGLGFYEHAETPGLGGEVDNPRWKKIWPGKEVYDQSGEPAIQLVKGNVNPSDPNSVYKVDALAGATLTSRGVENLVQFWVGDLGFGPYLKRVQSGEI